MFKTQKGQVGNKLAALLWDLDWLTNFKGDFLTRNGAKQ